MNSYKLFSLGDQAIVVEFGNVIDEKVNDRVITFFNYINANPFTGFIEAVPAYSTVTVFYNLGIIKKNIEVNETVLTWVENTLHHILPFIKEIKESESRLIEIPVCYDDEYAPDLRWVADIKGITAEEVIQSHTSKTYRVYMMGFLPGFAYMGEVNDNIDVPRKTNPRIKIEAGSVGIAGKQTGIYPLASPGGWQIIGRTAWRLFDPGKTEQSVLQSGDRVRFYPISQETYLAQLNGYK